MTADSMLERIVAIILSYRKTGRIVLFGSRARGDALPASDVDIAIDDPAWTREDIAEVHGRLEEEVATPLKIDLLAMHLVRSPELLARIRREGVVIHE